AFLISSAEAPFGTPRAPYRSLVAATRDHHPRRTDHPVTEPVALLQHLDDASLLGLRRLGEKRFVDMRIELSVSRDLLEALLPEQVGERARHERDAFLQLGLLVRLGSLERALQVVQNRQELLHEPLVGAGDQALLVTRRPVAVVVALRAGPS